MDGYYAWMLISASLVLLMTTPGLALFYGGMSRSTSVLNMMMMSFAAAGVVGVVYLLWGWSMAYSSTYPSTDGHRGADVAMVFASPFQQFGLEGTDPHAYVFVAFQLTFAVITAALISGAIADRVKFSAWLLFLPLWVTLSYFPLAHMVWGGGLLSGAQHGVADLLFPGEGAAAVVPIDYAGGTVVHLNAGVAALVLILLVGKRVGFGRDQLTPHNLTLTMIGAGLLWFGWFGFNAGSIVFTSTEEGAMQEQFMTETGLVWVNTMAATAAAMLGWLAVERWRHGKATSLGAASGVVAGLVAVTPACGAVSPLGALVLGSAAGAICALAVELKYRWEYDDSLDVVGVHLVGALVGTIGVGLLATDSGLFYGHGAAQLVVQVAITAVAAAWAGVATLIAGLIVRAVLGWRISLDDEVAGIDLVQHGEVAYDLHLSGAGRGLVTAGAIPAGPTRATPGTSHPAEDTH